MSPVSVAERLQAMRPTEIGVPGPTPTDMARAFRSVRRDPLGFLVQVREHYGDTVAFPVPGAPALLVNDPADVAYVLKTAARSWTKQTVQYAALGRVTGPGLLASAEPTWIEHRRAAAPAFHHHRLAAVSEQVRRAADAVLTEALPTTPGARVVVDVSGLMHRIALDAVGRALFAADLSGHARQLLRATSDAAELVVRLGRSILPTAEWAPTWLNLRLRRARHRLDTITGELIAERRSRLAAAGAGGPSGDDLLGLLLDSGLTDREVRDELVTMVIAGHETVAASLTWTLMLLAEHPEAQERSRAELDGLTGGTGPVSLLHGREQVPWTRALVDEALRLYPPAWVVSRRSTRDDTLGALAVPAGTLAIISPWLVHRHPDVWSQPETFRPERFLAPAAGRHAYLPFGQGPRLCIGRDFALGEMVVVLGRILESHRLELPSGWSRPRPSAQVAVHPRGGMPLVLTALPGPRP